MVQYNRIYRETARAQDVPCYTTDNSEGIGHPTRKSWGSDWKSAAHHSLSGLLYGGCVRLSHCASICHEVRKKRLNSWELAGCEASGPRI